MASTLYPASERADSRIKTVPMLSPIPTPAPFIAKMNTTPATDRSVDSFCSQVDVSFRNKAAIIIVKIGTVAVIMPASDDVV